MKPGIACLLLLVALAGCTDENVPPITTSEQVLDRQYAARAPHGAMSGPEAGIIADAYRAHIGVPLVPADKQSPAQPDH